ncbi:MAG TPA: HIT domain-containing protein [Candidatus Binatia bacterium]|nr:HIT domain-containing protein [Candidatus Binatia bacterium]
MTDCIFCKIAAGAVPATVVYRDEAIVAIEDLNPQAPTHLLVMPVEHHATIVSASAAGGLVGKLVAAASRLGTQRGGENGFRLVVNTGPDGGQTVGHVHLHVLAGRQMTWPPG